MTTATAPSPPPTESPTFWARISGRFRQREEVQAASREDLVAGIVAGTIDDDSIIDQAAELGWSIDELRQAADLKRRRIAWRKQIDDWQAAQRGDATAEKRTEVKTIHEAFRSDFTKLCQKHKVRVTPVAWRCGCCNAHHGHSGAPHVRHALDDEIDAIVAREPKGKPGHAYSQLYATALESLKRRQQDLDKQRRELSDQITLVRQGENDDAADIPKLELAIADRDKFIGGKMVTENTKRELRERQEADQRSLATLKERIDSRPPKVAALQKQIAAIDSQIAAVREEMLEP